MKRVFCQRLPITAPIFGLAFAAIVSVGCSDSSSDPSPVSVDELKGPGKLTISDEGDGKIKLKWTGSNNEDDFDGYNIYGRKAATAGHPATIGGLSEGSALQLLDNEGEAIAAAKSTLLEFNYNPSNGLGLAAPLADNNTQLGIQSSGSKDEEKFEALPIHQLNGTGEDAKRLLPTCKNDGTGNCVNTTADNEGQTVEDNNSRYAVNGPISYSLSGLKVGSTYCFLVLSTFDRGEKVSQSSSNLACITPKFAKTATLTLPETGNIAFPKLDLSSWIAACGTGSNLNSCPEVAAYYAADSKIGGHIAEDAGPVYVEYDSNVGQVFVAGKNSAIADLGYYADGFADSKLPAKAPKLTLDSNPISDTNNAPILNQGGYSIAGQSIILAKNHVYVFAVGDAKATTLPNKFHYVWAYIKDKDAGTVEFRLPKDAE